MKLQSKQLRSHLEQTLAPIYLITGDEHLLVQEASDEVRQKAVAEGFTDRHRLIADSDFNWLELPNLLNSGSLFSSKTLIDITVPDAKFGDKGGKVLLSLTENWHDDTRLIISTSKIDASRQRSKWYKAVESIGCVIAIWPIDRRQMMQWLQERSRKYGLQLQLDALKIIALRAEGNLLSADQALQKLSLQFEDQEITADQAQSAVASTSRFDVFKLIDSAISGESERVINILTSLQYQGVEAIFILWALAKECRLLLACHYALDNQQDPVEVFQKQRVWPQRRPLVQSALRRTTRRDCMKILAQCRLIDEAIKGTREGCPWRGLRSLYLALAGEPLKSLGG